LLPAVASLSKTVSFANPNTTKYYKFVVHRMKRYWYDQPRAPHYEHETHMFSARAMRHAIRRARSLASEVAQQLHDAGTPARGVAGKPAREDGKTVASSPRINNVDWVGPTQWIMDTGSAVDLVSTEDIPARTRYSCKWAHDGHEASGAPNPNPC
jgi:hypothetical protein